MDGGLSPGAVAAEPFKFQSRSGDEKILRRGFQPRGIRRFPLGQKHIAHLAAGPAAHVIMRGGVAVETAHRPTRLDLLDLPGGRQKIQIAVDRAQTDARQPGPHHGVDFFRGGVRHNLAQFFQNDLALTGHARLRALHTSLSSC